MKPDAVDTEKVIGLIRNERAVQKQFGFADDERTKGELIAAAISYADTSRQQVLVRNHREADAVARRRNQVYNPSVPTGGTPYGYPAGFSIAAKPHESWPFSKSMWVPQEPKRNLVKAAALIIAELERLEREDRKRFSTLAENEQAARYAVYDSAAADLFPTDPTHGGKVYPYQNVNQQAQEIRDYVDHVILHSFTGIPSANAATNQVSPQF